MLRPLRFVVMSLLLPFAGAEAAWVRRAVSDELSPASTWNSSPCAGATGVVWASKQPYALAFWDRSGARYLTPLPPWGGYSPIGEPSLWGDEVAYTLSGLSCPTSILYWDGQDSHRISYQSCPNGHPSLFAGRIAWDDYPRACWPWPCEPEDSEIWFWNGYGAWQVTDNDVDDRYPSLYDLTIAWESEGNVLYATIRNPELAVPPTPVVVGEGQRPSLFRKQIAYYASDGNDSEIFLYDIETTQTLQVTDNDYHDFNPRLYDGTIIWQAYDGNDVEIFYWDGRSIQQLTDNDIPDTEPTLWGTGLDTTIACVETSLEPPVTFLDRIICLRPAVTASTRGADGRIVLTWPSLEGRAYRVEYSDDLVNWKVAAESVPSAGYGETSWTDGPDSGTSPPPSEVPQRFYRVCEKE